MPQCQFGRGCACRRDRGGQCLVAATGVGQRPDEHDAKCDIVRLTLARTTKPIDTAVEMASAAFDQSKQMLELCRFRLFLKLLAGEFARTVELDTRLIRAWLQRELYG